MAWRSSFRPVDHLACLSSGSSHPINRSSTATSTTSCFNLSSSRQRTAPITSHNNLRQVNQKRTAEPRPRIVQDAVYWRAGTCFTRQHSMSGDQPVHVHETMRSWSNTADGVVEPCTTLPSLACDRQWLFPHPFDRLTMIATRVPCLEEGFWIQSER